MGKVIGVCAEHAEIVGAVRVLPDVFGVDHQISSERLLQAGVEFVAPAGTERRGQARMPCVDHDGD